MVSFFPGLSARGELEQARQLAQTRAPKTEASGGQELRFIVREPSKNPNLVARAPHSPPQARKQMLGLDHDAPPGPLRLP